MPNGQRRSSWKTPSWEAKKRIDETKAITIPYQPLPNKEARDENKEEEK
jgi:hypothetical protein